MTDTPVLNRTEMRLSIPALRKEYNVRKWAQIFGGHPYVAVVQLTGGTSWGRSNMKWRVLGDLSGNKCVGARYCTPRVGREGAMRTRYVGLAELLRGGTCAVVYGTQLNEVVDVLDRSLGMINGATLIGGRFGDQIVSAKVWHEVRKSDGELAQWQQFVHALDNAPSALVKGIDTSSTQLLDTLDNAGGAKNLVTLLTQHSANGHAQTDVKEG